MIFEIIITLSQTNLIIETAQRRRINQLITSKKSKTGLVCAVKMHRAGFNIRIDRST